MNPSESLTARDVVFRYSKARDSALKGISCDFPRGSVTALLGHNGAGKTTLLFLLAGAAQPRSGVIRLAGEPVHKSGVRSRIGFQSERFQLWRDFTVRDCATIASRLYGSPIRDVENRWDEFGLLAHGATRVGGLSTGLRKRLDVAFASTGDPLVLLLDEPFASVDLESSAVIRERLTEWRRQGRTVVVSSHDLPELNAVADRVAVLKSGGLVASGPTGDLFASAHLHGRTRVTTDISEYETGTSPEEITGLLRDIVRKSELVMSIDSTPPSLADLYAAVTAGESTPGTCAVQP